MPNPRARLPSLIAIAALAGLSACQPPAAGSLPPDPGTGRAPADAALAPALSAAAPAGCPAGLRAVLSNGLAVQYDGPQARDMDICLARWQGVAHPYYLGFWGDGRTVPQDAQERQAVRAALTGPVGTETSFTAHGGKLWNAVTVTHVADPVLTVAGQPRPTVQLRRVLHDALGRHDVRAEALIWVDQATGIALRRQTITHMADGGQNAVTTWDVRDLAPA